MAEHPMTKTDTWMAERAEVDALDAAAAVFMAAVAQAVVGAYPPGELDQWQPDERQALYVQSATIGILNQDPEILMHRKLHGLGMAYGQLLSQIDEPQDRVALQTRFHRGAQIGLTMGLKLAPKGAA